MLSSSSLNAAIVVAACFLLKDTDTGTIAIGVGLAVVIGASASIAFLQPSDPVSARDTLSAFAVGLRRRRGSRRGHDFCPAFLSRHKSPKPTMHGPGCKWRVGRYHLASMAERPQRMAQSLLMESRLESGASQVTITAIIEFFPVNVRRLGRIMRLWLTNVCPALL